MLSLFSSSLSGYLEMSLTSLAPYIRAFSQQWYVYIKGILVVST